MLSNEEKKLIEYTKEEYKKGKEQDNVLFPIYLYQAEIIINLIKKQSEEIEELKEKNRQGKMRIVQLENEITARIENVNKYFTPNNKIKAKIEEVQDGTYDAKIVLQSLLRKEFPVTITKEELEKRWKE